MAHIDYLVGRETEQALRQAAQPRQRQRRLSPRRVLLQLGDTVAIARADGSEVTALATAHFPKEEWEVIVTGLQAGEYTRTGDGCVRFAE
jgi:class 3 adenylate cyclase